MLKPCFRFRFANFIDSVDDAGRVGERRLTYRRRKFEPVTRRETRTANGQSVLWRRSVRSRCDRAQRELRVFRCVLVSFTIIDEIKGLNFKYS